MAKKAKEQPRYKVIWANTPEELQDKINAEADYQVVNHAVTSYWMHMVVVHEYTAVMMLRGETN